MIHCFNAATDFACFACLYVLYVVLCCRRFCFALHNDFCYGACSLFAKWKREMKKRQQKSEMFFCCCCCLVRFGRSVDCVSCCCVLFSFYQYSHSTLGWFSSVHISQFKLIEFSANRSVVLIQHTSLRCLSFLLLLFKNIFFAKNKKRIENKIKIKQKKKKRKKTLNRFSCSSESLCSGC